MKRSKCCIAFIPVLFMVFAAYGQGDALSHTVEWEVQLDGVASSPTLFPNATEPTAVAVAAGKELVLVAGDGSVLWRVAFEKLLSTAPTIADLDGDDAYREAFEEQVLPTTAAFKPEFLLASIGFDAHRRDPLAQINLTTDAYGWMARAVRTLADSLCEGRLVTVLEGGYDLEAIADCTQAHVEMLDTDGSQ